MEAFKSMQHQEALLKHDHISLVTNPLSPIVPYLIGFAPTSCNSLHRTTSPTASHASFFSLANTREEPFTDYLVELHLQFHIYHRNGSRTDIARRRL
jgi:hypothetical protein